MLLDNLEQVVDAAAVIADLLSRLPDLCVIATSRERLAISFEQEYPVPPLDEAAAEELFVTRARELDPGFKSDQAVGELCSRLDRLPLALELASSRVKLMTTEQILSRIERRLDLLTAGKLTLPRAKPRCAPRSNGASSSCPNLNRPYSADSGCSPAASRSRPRKPSVTPTSTVFSP